MLLPALIHQVAYPFAMGAFLWANLCSSASGFLVLFLNRACRVEKSTAFGGVGVFSNNSPPYAQENHKKDI